MHIIISSYSKNSLALIQWAAEKRLQQVTVCHVETGWSAEGWPEFVSRAEAFVRDKGFDVQRLVSRVTFADLMDIKRGFPSREHQWCSLHLKGITLLQWLDEKDPECQATLLMGNRNPEQLTEKPVPEYVESSEYLGGRRLWYPLFELGDQERDALLSRTGLNPPAGGGCAPCINASTAELSRLSEMEIHRTEELEEDLGVPMFGALYGKSADIRSIVRQAKQHADDEARPFKFGCSAEFGCGG